MKDQPKTIRLSETTNIMHVIAEQQIKINGEYRCIFNGEKIRVIAD
jgi:hypothetical protein